jgi:hypothetical protein
MRKFLLASVATLGTGGLTGVAMAQPAGGPVGAPTQGQQAYPAAPSPTAYVNNNNNYQAPALPGPLANPTPGTIVIHVNGKVQVDYGMTWTSADTRFAGTFPATAANPVVGQVKLQPQTMFAFAREYFGADGMATNGLRYGAAIELRENFTGTISSNASSGASSQSSLQTVFVRRAFTYVAGDSWGIVRLGQADGLIGIFDNGVTTTQFLPTGNFNGGDTQALMPTNVPPPFVFLSQAGNEYDNVKAVYLSPQIAGFDFGVQYAPDTSNGLGISGSAGGLATNGLGTLNAANSGLGTGISCTVANSGCPTLSAGPGGQDGSRGLNQWAVGLRYQGVFGGAGVLAYAVGEFSGHADYTGPGLVNPGTATLNAAGLANLGMSAGLVAAGGTYNGQYKNLKIGSGGIAVTFAGFTVAGNVIGGNMNGQLGLQPQGGSPLFAFTFGAKYVSGPLTIGAVVEEMWMQGSPQLSGISQYRGRGINVGASYTVAPGYQVFGEYLWNDQYQGARNFVTGALGTAAGSNANNTIRGQGFVIGNVVNF